MLSSDLKRAHDLVAEARAARFRGESAAAEAAATEAAATADRLGNRLLKLSALRVLGGIRHDLGDLDGSTRCYRQALALAEEEGTADLLAPCLDGVAICLMQAGSIAEGFALQRRAVTMVQEAGNPPWGIMILNNHGDRLRTLGDYAGALRLHRVALDTARSVKDMRGVAISSLNLGEVAMAVGDLREARRCFQIAVRLGRSARRVGTMALASLGSVALAQGRPRAAALQLRRAAAQARELGYPEPLASALRDLGVALRRMGNATEAEAAFADALAASRACGDMHSRAQVLLAMAEGGGPEAQRLAEEALDTARRLEARKLEAAAHDLLSRAAEEAGDLPGALHHSRAAAAIRAQAGEAERRSGLSVLHAVFSLERAEREAEMERLKSVELAAALRAAEKASETKSRFLSNMSHELRTPLNSIIGFARLLKEPDGAASRLEWAGDIEQAGLHLLGLINDLLDFSKMEAGGLAVSPEPCELAETVHAIMRMKQAMAQQRGVRLLADLPDGPVTVQADPKRLRQILLNLLSNALKFTPAGGQVTVRLRREEDALRLSVEDTGIGMSEEELPVALAVFGQVSNTYTKAHDGTGLGLPITKGLVELHGWRFGLTSTPGTGTCVCITIPVDVCVPAA